MTRELNMNTLEQANGGMITTWGGSLDKELREKQAAAKAAREMKEEAERLNKLAVARQLEAELAIKEAVAEHRKALGL